MDNLFLSIRLYWRSVLEVVIFWFVIYKVLVSIDNTKAFAVAKGVFIFAVFIFLVHLLGLQTISALFERGFEIAVIGLIVIFQPELRNLFARIGKGIHLQGLMYQRKHAKNVAGMVSAAVEYMTERKVGALIAIEGSVSLRQFEDTGVVMNAEVSTELLESIFFPENPLHDGGVIIRGNKIAAAACLFPLTENPAYINLRGTRHKAGIGITEYTDAICIIVSEETADVSLAANGQIKLGIPSRELYQELILLLDLQLKKKKVDDE